LSRISAGLNAEAVHHIGSERARKLVHNCRRPVPGITEMVGTEGAVACKKTIVKSLSRGEGRCPSAIP
jgi:hypothetical protein